MIPWYVAFGRLCLLVLQAMVEQGLRFLPFWLLGALLGSLLSAGATGPRLLVRLPPLLRGVGGGVLLGVVNPTGVHGAWGLLDPLERAGWSGNARLAFLVATGLIGPTHIVYTLALGPALTLARLAVVVGVAVLAALLLGRRPLPVVAPAHPPQPPPTWGGRPGPPEHAAGHPRQRPVAATFWRTLRWSAPHVALGLGLSAWLSVLLPRTPVGSLAVGWGGPLLALTGIPLYVCGGAAIPLVAEGLRLGAPAGAGVAFLVIGAATSPMHLAAWEKLLGRATTLRVLAIVVGIALLLALV